MSLRQWHSILPSGAFNSSALAEDLAPVLQQSSYFGKKHVLLASEDGGGDHFPRIERSIRENGLTPQCYISLDEFAVSKRVIHQMEQGSHFVVIIDREPSAAAIERMNATRPYLDRLTYVVIGRKDWRFKDTFRALPHFVRSNLYLDFPVSIHSSDPFYSPAELALIIDELKESSGFVGPISFSPHFGLRRELLRANVIAVSGPGEIPGQPPEVSIIVSEPETVNRLAAEIDLQKLGQRIEFVVARVIGQETKPIHPTSAAVSHVWLHLEDTLPCPEIGAHLRNWGARYARGKTLVFADGEPADALAVILDRLLVRGEVDASVRQLGLGVVVATGRFREAGGYDPLYYRFNLGDAELLHRYSGGLSLDGEDSRLAEYLRGKIQGAYRGLAVGLFFHQYFDHAFFRYFSPNSSEATQADQESGSRLQNQFRYRMEQSRDAYIGIYKASPRVALDGHIQILLKPYHWIKPYFWLLKMPVYPLIVQPYHRVRLHAWLLKMPVYPLIVTPYHWIKPYAWLLKMPVYPLVVKPYHFLRQYVWRFLRQHIWKVKMPVYPLVVKPYHFLRQYVWRFLRQHVWKIKFIYYVPKVGVLRLKGYLLRLKGLFLRAKGQLWRVKQIYYFLFWLLFPVRKIYYFAEYQFEKRILGLYGRQHVWIRK